MSDEMDPRLRSAFEALRAESAEAPDRGAMETARRAMHHARAIQPERSGVAVFAALLRTALSPRLLVATGGTLVAALAAVAVIGWNAPAGTPLHGIRVAHESLQLAFPGADRVALDLDYAESRMQDAQQSSGSWSSSLDEAARYLDDARQHLQSGSPLWPRWQDDESLLAALRHDDDHGTTPPNPGGSETESRTTQSGGASGEGGDDRGSSGSTSSSTAEEHESSSSSSVEEHSSSSSSSSSEGGGGSDGGGSSSSTSSGGTSSSSDGGGSGGSGSDG